MKPRVFTFFKHVSNYTINLNKMTQHLSSSKHFVILYTRSQRKREPKLSIEYYNPPKNGNRIYQLTHAYTHITVATVGHNYPWMDKIKLK